MSCSGSLSLGEANTYGDPARRGDAIERAADDLVQLLGTCRRNIHRTIAWVKAEEKRQARASKEEAARKARARVVELVG